MSAAEFLNPTLLEMMISSKNAPDKIRDLVTLLYKSSSRLGQLQ
jgi:hypothetical protein